MKREHEKLQNSVNYGGSRVVVITDNSKLPIAYVGEVVFCLEDNNNKLTLKSVYHVPGMKKNLLSVS